MTTQLGLYCESSYELEAYDNLCAAHRLFYKPYFSSPEYDDLWPDILFLDTQKPVIGEIFGFSSPDYLLERARKLQVAHELQDQYGFWKWDAYAQEPFPALPPVARNRPRTNPPGRAMPDQQEDTCAPATLDKPPPLELLDECAARSPGQEEVLPETQQAVTRARARQKIAPTFEQARELEEEFYLQLEEAGYVKVSDDRDEKKDPPNKAPI